MKVMKFGGGCLKDSESFSRVAEVIKTETALCVVVVSAVSGITDLLLESIEKSQQNEKNVAKALSEISGIHTALINETIKNREICQEICRNLEARLGRLEKLLYGISFTGEISPSIRSHILSFGERFAALLLAGVLRSKGVESEDWESDKIGMITEEAYENATVNLGLFKDNFSPYASRIRQERFVPVITGFFGSTPEGRISTFGRNGSDYSAAVIAYALGADDLEIWKDVNGFMSADPKIVPNPVTLNSLSYYEAAELSYFGAKILHPRTLEPLTGMNISIVIKNLLQPEGSGTLITPEGSEKEDVVKSVTYNSQIAMLRIHGPGVGFKPGIIGQIGQRLADLGINIYSVITSQTCINLLVDKKDARKSYEELKKTEDGVVKHVDLDEDITLIAVVGEGLLKKTGLAARIFSAVSRENINVEMISSGASEVATYFIVQSDQTEKAVNALHKEFYS